MQQRKKRQSCYEPVSKRFATVSTSVGFVPGVGPHVSLQQPGPGESFATNLALVAEVVCEDVHGEGRHADVHLDTQAHEVSQHKVHKVTIPCYR